MRFVWVLLVLFVTATAAFAQTQTRYISDRTLIELRRGPSTEYLILRSLEAGDVVDVLEQDASSGYSRVRTRDNGTEGWVLTRYLVAEPIARDKLASAERNLATAQSRVKALEQQVSALTTELESAKAQLDETRTSQSQVSKELADIRSASANVVEIRDQNESLRQRLIQRDREVEEITHENTQLASRDRQNWFIVGAGVLFGGIVIGLIAPSLRRKRRSDW
jgi:SH3 domain protein